MPLHNYFFNFQKQFTLAFQSKNFFFYTFLKVSIFLFSIEKIKIIYAGMSKGISAKKINDRLV